MLWDSVDAMFAWEEEGPGAMCVMVSVGLRTLATIIITMEVTIISMVGMAVTITIIIMVAWTTDPAHFVVDLAAEGVCLAMVMVKSSVLLAMVHVT